MITPPLSDLVPVSALRAQHELLWCLPAMAKNAIPRGSFSADDVARASARLRRFAPYLADIFPQTAATGGLIESPLTPAPRLQAALTEATLPGTLWLKHDHALPVAGSIKARGGFHEVLRVAEDLALAAGLVTAGGDYRIFNTPQARALFATQSLAVGSTGNLGLSIGMMGAHLGFAVTVHMSADAKAWKKALLRSHGVTVIEYASDYSAAVTQGRAEAAADPACHFVDDERSADLFLGYAVAAERLADQLTAQGVRINAQHPLFVSLPCGVGGAPGGVAYGLKLVFGDAVHCLFAEPTAAPCMLLGLSSGLHDGICVQDIGLDGQTCADGLAVGRPSALVGRLMAPLLAGLYTVSDASMLRLVAKLEHTEGLFVEPSAAASLPGMAWICGPQGAAYRATHGLTDQIMAQATHIAWLTGGSLVPDDERRALLAQGAALLAETEA